MRKTLAYYIKLDPNVSGPYMLVRSNHIQHCLFWEVRGKSGHQHTNWYVTFNGNSKQRRQQQRKMIRDLNQ